MTNSDDPWEPPLAGTDVEQLLGALERLRTTFRWKVDDLDAAGLQTRVGASSLTLGGLLKHLAAAEEYMFTTKLTGQPIGAPWDANLSWPDGSRSADYRWMALTSRNSSKPNAPRSRPIPELL